MTIPMGHASIRVTKHVDAHFLPVSKSKATKTMEQMRQGSGVIASPFNRYFSKIRCG